MGRTVSVITGVCLVSVVCVMTFSLAAPTPDEHVSPQVVGAADTSGLWTSVGPLPFMNINIDGSASPNSGRIASVAVDPTDPRHWLIGFGNGGLWESRNAGDGWTPLTDAAPTLAVGAVAFARSAPGTVYAATGEATAQTFTRSGSGMLKSTDGGRSWVLLGASNLARAAVRRVQVDPTNPNIVEVTVSRGGHGRDSHHGTPGSPPFGILKSTDGGRTWVRTLAGMATALEVDPTNFNSQYAAIGETAPGPAGIDNDAVGSVPNGLYRSTDGGQTWAPIDGPWGSAPTRPTVGRVELAIAPSNPNVLYASMQMGGGVDSAGFLGLFRTDNAWAPVPTWMRVPTEATGAGYCVDPGEGSKCGYTHVITVDPGDPNTLFAGGARIWRCTNCASSPVWRVVQELLHADFHAMAWAGTRLIVGTDGGIWSTADSGATWQNHNIGLPTLMFYGGALHPTEPNVMFGGFRDFRPAIRTQANTWVSLRELPAPGNCGEGEVAISSSRPETDWMFAGTWGTVCRTTDGGITGIRADAGIDTNSASFVAAVRECPSNDDVFLTGTNRVWRSNDFFTSVTPTWTPNSPPSTFPNSHYSPGTIQGIAFSPSDASCDTYAYGNWAGQVRLTRDGGRTWKDLDPAQTLPRRPVNSLAFDPTNANILYAAISSFDEATPGRPGHVFKTTNGTEASPSWVNVSPPLNQPFNSIAVDPTSPNVVYAGSDTGLWQSTDAATTWQPVGLDRGLPPATVYDIQINSVTRRIVTFTYGRGAYASTTATTTTAGGLAPPTNLQASVVGDTVMLTWSAPSTGGPSGYVIDAGTGPGLANLATLPIATTSFTAVSVPRGTYYVRVRSASGGERSAPSNEVVVNVGTPGGTGCTTEPPVPSTLTSTVAGQLVTMQWTAAPGAVSYVIEAGSSSGNANIVVFDTGSAATTFTASAVPGTYYVRVRARNACGTSGPSNERVIVVP
jgi:photosystem II stability/assembly factor-like uncharacterized protein